MGRTARNVSEADALSYVSLLHRQRPDGARSAIAHESVDARKSADNFGPIGRIS